MKLLTHPHARPRADRPRLTKVCLLDHKSLLDSAKFVRQGDKVLHFRC